MPKKPAAAAPVLDPPSLIERARLALHLDKRELAKALGMSPRTVYRWKARMAWPRKETLRELAVKLHPVDPALASDLAVAGGTTSAAMGLMDRVKVAPGALAAESVVGAAADVLGLPPKGVRPAVVAALHRAQALGVSVEALLAALEQP
ncbi:MAG: helix-turn-helix transcriptional regulator [Deltaproteobacteria bacterium]|nr:helix-turn-helix transcriptional regulator [Deltaproteobacteria bacterium]